MICLTGVFLLARLPHCGDVSARPGVPLLLCWPGTAAAGGGRPSVQKGACELHPVCASGLRWAFLLFQGECHGRLVLPGCVISYLLSGLSVGGLMLLYGV